MLLRVLPTNPLKANFATRGKKMEEGNEVRMVTHYYARHESVSTTYAYNFVDDTFNPGFTGPTSIRCVKQITVE